MIYYGQMETEAFAMTYVHFDADDLKKNALPAALGCVCFPVPLILCPKSRLGRFCANQGLVLLLAYIAVQLAFAVIGAVTGWIPLIGWVIKPKTIIEEVTLGGFKFGRERLYVIMVKIVTPIMLLFLLLQSLGLFTL